MKKKQRSFWVSLVLVGLLALGSVALFLTGTRPVLGLDLEGGVSVILSAPEGTPDTVMNQALENIRNRIDAFGTAEPLLFVTGNTIEVQIPGLARGTIEERAKRQFCVADDEGTTYGCFATKDAADAELASASVQPVVSSVCLTDDPTDEAVRRGRALRRHRKGSDQRAGRDDRQEAAGTVLPDGYGPPDRSVLPDEGPGR
jgi:preprotein translocase subunit SecD